MGKARAAVLLVDDDPVVVLLERREVLGGLARPAPLGGQPVMGFFRQSPGLSG